MDDMSMLVEWFARQMADVSFKLDVATVRAGLPLGGAIHKNFDECVAEAKLYAIACPHPGEEQ